MTEQKRAVKKKKRKIRINYSKMVRAFAVVFIAVWLIISVLEPLFGASTGYNRDLIRPAGGADAEKLSLSASSAVMYSLDLDRTVYEKNPDERMAPYSITKLLTCYLALEKLPHEKVVTISKNAATVLENGTRIELKEGERISVLDLVYGAMLPSGNDAATALGEAVSGDINSFANLMNEQVEEWGCENTHFVNANGWRNEDHYTTAHDMAIIASRCLSNETLKKVSATKRYKIPATNMSAERDLRNALLYTLKNVKTLTGGKTGSWVMPDGYTVAFEFEDRGLDAVVVLLGDTKKGRPEDAALLTKSSHDIVPGFMVTKKGDKVCEVWVKHGEKTRIPVYAKKLCYTYPENGSESGVRVVTDLNKTEAPVKKGDRVGIFKIYANGEEADRGYLYASEDVDKGWLPSYLYISNRTTLYLILFIITSVFLVELLKRRQLQKEAAQKHRRRQ